MIPTVWALGLDRNLPVKVLAIIGAAAVGGLLLGFVVQLVARTGLGRPLPSWAAWIFRVLGGVASGLIVASLLSGGGEGMGGGDGWWPFGTSGQTGSTDGTPKEKQKKEKKKEEEKPKGKDRDKDKGGKSPPPNDVLSIEVLGNKTLTKLASGGTIDLGKRYRLQGTSALLDLRRIKKVIAGRCQQTPALRQLQVILYRDSPAANEGSVTGLKSYARDVCGDDLELKDVINGDKDAPVPGE